MALVRILSPFNMSVGSDATTASVAWPLHMPNRGAPPDPPSIPDIDPTDVWYNTILGGGYSTIDGGGAYNTITGGGYDTLDGGGYTHPI